MSQVPLDIQAALMESRWDFRNLKLAPFDRLTFTKQDWEDRMGLWYVPVTETGCWIWLRALCGGYGRIWEPRTKSNLVAHRMAYEIMVAPVPTELHVDHLCRQPACVNPSHLEAVTPWVNTMRGVGPAVWKSKITVCPKGHEYTPENTKMKSNGTRRCRECARQQCRESLKRMIARGWRRGPRARPGNG